jgi:hypothetical protein
MTITSTANPVTYIKYTWNQCFSKFQQFADYFIGGWRTWRPAIFCKIPHTQKCMQMNRRKNVLVVKVPKSGVAQICMGICLFHSVSDTILAMLFLHKPPVDHLANYSAPQFEKHCLRQWTMANMILLVYALSLKSHNQTGVEECTKTLIW